MHCKWLGRPKLKCKRSVWYWRSPPVNHRFLVLAILCGSHQSDTVISPTCYSEHQCNARPGSWIFDQIRCRQSWTMGQDSLVVTIGGKLCRNTAQINVFQLTCATPAGTGRNLAVVVSAGAGLNSTQSFSVSYDPPSFF
ncbi:hypothetical protein BKA69DRAFT_1106193, partial [Paraphysoderma sedebokerense]